PGDRHHRAVALGLDDLNGADPVTAAADTNLAHHVLHSCLDRIEREAPLALAALEAHLVETTQRRQVARKRRAYAFDKSPDHRLVLQREGAAPVERLVLEGQPVTLQYQTFLP